MAKGRKTGGRKTGTPNKVTTTVRSAITKMLDEYYTSERFEKDLEDLDPKDRIAAIEKFTSYAIPRLQNTSLDIVEESRQTIEQRLASLAGGE